MTKRHIPVLLDEVIEALAPADGAVIVDGTFGAGGYTEALLKTADCRVVAIDRDPSAIAGGADLARAYGERLQLIEGRLSTLADILDRLGYSEVDGVAFDLGVSSMQIDDAARGFSFQADGPLDMRMGGDGPSAADIVNEMGETELADIIYRYGEERRSRAVARAIVSARRDKPISGTAELAAVVAGVVRRDGKQHPATRTFQALRIWVNDELGELERGLAAAEAVLRPGGRLAVVSFHSLEDRVAKQFLQRRAGVAPGGSRHLPPQARETRAPSFRLLFRGTRSAGEAETKSNPRARSARLRAAARTEAPAWPAEVAA
ncbi:MAG: 16S rRNA (cytosine(1402)-N(4))-methyltransferase RsmH [Alphaproteobacteria bacterium]